MNVAKLHKFASVIIGVLFLVTVQTFAAPRPVYRFLAPAFFLYLALVTWYNYWYLTKTQRYNFWMLIRPVLLLLSAFGIFWFLPLDFLRGVFLIGAAAVTSFVEYFLGNFSENILLNENLLIAFGAFLAFAGNDMYYPAYHSWYLPGVFAAAYLVTRTFYEFVPQTKRMKIVSSITLALFSAELFWGLSFLPFHYSVIAILLFNVFYFCLILNYYYIYKTLSVKKIQFHFILMAATSALLLILTPWQVLK